MSMLGLDPSEDNDSPTFENKRAPGIIGAVVSAAGFYAAQHGSEIIEFLFRVLGPTKVAILAVVVVIVGGGFAFWFKRRSQLMYGAVEMLFGCLSALSVALTLAPGKSLIAQWASLAGSAYVIARGLSNVSDGMKLNTRTSAASHT
jgi:hypothetical protein